MQYLYSTVYLYSVQGKGSIDGNGIIEVFTITKSDGFLSDYHRSEVTQNKINFIKNCSQCGLNPRGCWFKPNWEQCFLTFILFCDTEWRWMCEGGGFENNILANTITVHNGQLICWINCSEACRIYKYLTNNCKHPVGTSQISD